MSFNPGVTGPSTFTVTVNGDTAAEIDETLVVNLSGATGGAVITRAQGVGTITDDDATTDRRATLAAWSAAVGVTASGGRLTKTAIVGWNAGAASAQALLDGDGSMEFTATRDRHDRHRRPEPRRHATPTSPTSTSVSSSTSAPPSTWSRAA